MKSLSAVLLSLSLITACANGLPNQMPDANSNPNPVSVPITEFKTTSSEVNYHSQKNVVKGYLARPEQPGKYPTLILIHEWWGLNDNIREFADNFAKQGYVALAVDLYDGKATDKPEEARTLAGNVRSNLPVAVENLTQAVNYLKTQSDVNPDQMASVGWCFGGNWSYEMAKNNMGVKASVMYYGSFSLEDDLSQMKTHIIGHFGEKDTSIKVDDVKQFQATLKTQSGEHEVYIYPNAGHGFANADNATAYNKEAADQAWQRTLTFLKEHL